MKVYRFRLRLWVRCFDQFKFAVQFSRILSGKTERAILKYSYFYHCSFKMAKVMTTPIMALLQFTFYRKRFTRGILATLGLVCVGVCWLLPPNLL